MENKQLKTLYRTTFLYLALPLAVFIIGWLSYIWAALFTLLLGIGLYWVCKYVNVNKDWTVSRREILTLAIIAFFWCFFAGIGYFYYQSFDYHFRNAVFRDLINYEWPVMYDKANTPLVYYMAFWLPAAAIAKLFSVFGMTAETQFLAGNILLLIYAVIGVTLILLHLTVAVNAKGLKQGLIAVTIFILFSGLDIIGYHYFLVSRPAFKMHYEWWAIAIQYSSMTTDLFWVFNQFIPIALIMLMVYNERNIKHFGFLIALALFFSPYPTAGIGIFTVVYAVSSFYHSSNKLSFILTQIFSVPNIVGVFWLIPLSILYFITNSDGMSGLIYIFSYTTPKVLITFLVIEVLLYAAILVPRYRHDMFVITAFIALMIIPFCRLDQQNNFCMRASIPPLMIFAIYSIRYLFEGYYEKKHRLTAIILVILLEIGAATPLMEFYRGVYHTTTQKKLNLVSDEIYTLNQDYVQMPIFGWDANHQFTAKKYKTDIFWQYMAKKHRPDGR